MKFDDQLFSKWKSLADTELNWYGSDSEENYKSNFNNNFQKLEKHNWINNHFTYKFNSYGFRCEEFTESDSIMFLGCSVTLGVGLPLESIFPEIVSKHLKFKCMNLGVGGSSSDTGFRLIRSYLSHLKPKIVVATFLFPERTELLTSLGDIHFTPNFNNDKKFRKYYFEYYQNWLERPENAQLNFIKNILAINKICDDQNIKFIDMNQLKISDIVSNDRARDLLHPGKDYHHQVSNLILTVL